MDAPQLRILHNIIVSPKQICILWIMWFYSHCYAASTTDTSSLTYVCMYVCVYVRTYIIV